MEKLEFTTNWNNKLDCKCFTTIRIYNPAKHFRGNKFEVYLQKQFKTNAYVIGTIVAKLEELSDYVCFLDTGYSKEETTAIFRKMYPKTDFETQKICVILLRVIEPPKPVQKNLFN